MVKRFLPWVLALIAFVVVGLSFASYESEVAWHNALGMQRLCYLQHGYTLGSGPQAVTAECSEPVFRYTQATWFYFAGAGAGLIAAAIVIGLFFLIRRNKPAL